MNNEAAKPAQPQTAARLHRKSVLDAVRSDQRWAILTALCNGGPLCVSDLAAELHIQPATISKHMMTLKNAGLVTLGRGKLYRIPPEHVPTPGQPVLDLGHCLLRLDVPTPE